MVHRAGKASDEYAVVARDLNQSFIGMHIGHNGDGVTTYGRLAACRLSEDTIDVWLDSVPGEDAHLRLDPSDHVYFARTTGDWQLRETVDKILDHLTSRA